MKFYDITLEIKEGMMVYPGNPGPSITRYASITKGRSNESLLTLGSHTGTHVDSMLHIQKNAPGADSLPLDSMYGKCRVLDLTSVESEIHKEDLEGFDIEKGEIILFKTKNSQLGYDEFRSDFVHVKHDAAEYLVELGVKTLGFDYLSVKKRGGDQKVHETLINNISLFEGLNLNDVPPGEYTFLGLPLRIASDGAPARVVLVGE